MISTNEGSDVTSHGKQKILLAFYNNVNCSIYIFATKFDIAIKYIYINRVPHYLLIYLIIYSILTNMWN